jgi:hypothetical protein
VTAESVSAAGRQFLWVTLPELEEGEEVRQVVEAAAMAVAAAVGLPVVVAAVGLPVVVAAAGGPLVEGTEVRVREVAPGGL